MDECPNILIKSFLAEIKEVVGDFLKTILKSNHSENRCFLLSNGLFLGVVRFCVGCKVSDNRPDFGIFCRSPPYEILAKIKDFVGDFPKTMWHNNRNLLKGYHFD